MRKLLLALALLALATPLFAQRVDLSTAGKLVRVADPQISPDGTTIAVVVSRANFAANRFDSELVAIDVASRAQRVLVTGRLALGAPRWSPDGSSIAFLALAGGQPQIFVLPAAGGEPRRITTSATPVLNYSWRPDGRAVANSAIDEPQAPREGTPWC